MKRYIKSSTSEDVFMLMNYSADTGPDTMGMEGDSFYCYGKFFAPSLESAKRDLERLKRTYPALKDRTGLYVDSYNPHFDSDPMTEDDIDMNPSAWGGVDYNVFSDLETLVKYFGLTKPYYSDDEVDLPFTI